MTPSSTTYNPSSKTVTLNPALAGGSGLGEVTYALQAAGDAACSVSGASLTYATAGSCQVTVTRAADTNYLTASSDLTFTVSQSTQTALTFGDDTVTYAPAPGNTVTLSASGGESSNPITYAVDVSGTNDANCTIAPGSTTLTYTSAGSCLVTATRLGDTNYSNDVTATATITVDPAEQTALTFGDDTVTYAPAPGNTVTLSASGGESSNPITYAVDVSGTNDANCTIAPGSTTLTYTSAGSCLVTATRLGDTNYSNDVTATATITVDPAEQTALTFGDDTVTYAPAPGNTVTLSASGGESSNPITYAVDVSGTNDANCTIAPGSTTLTYTSAGSCLVTATRLGDTNYSNDVTATATITVDPETQATALILTPTSTTYDASKKTLDLTASGGDSSADPTFTLVNAGSAGCSVSPGTTAGTAVLNYATSGSCTVKATKAGDKNYSGEVSSGDQVVTINAASQSITFDQVLTGVVGDQITLTASAGSGLAVAYVASGSCTVSGATLTLTLAGECSVTASQAGDGSYTAAAPVPRTFIVTVPRMVFSPPLQIKVGQTIDFTTTVSGGTGNVQFSATSPTGACEFAGTVLMGKASGTCEVEAIDAGAPVLPEVASIQVVDEAPPTIDQQALVVVPAGPLYYPGFTALSVSGGSGAGVVSYQVNNGPCTLNGTTLTSSATGVCTIQATKAGDGTYEAATSAPIDIAVGSSAAIEAATGLVQDSLMSNGRVMLGYNPTSNRLNARQGGESVGAFSPEGSSSEGSVAFSTSLSQIAQASGKSDKLSMPAGAPAQEYGTQVIPTSATRADAPVTPYSREAGSFDLWLDGKFFWYHDDDEDNGDYDSRGFLGEAGIDYLLSDDLLLGLSVRMDSLSGDAHAGDGALNTLGWMAGPYAVLELAPGLQIDGKVMWGQSSNDVSLDADGTRYDGSYDTTRLLGEGGIRGIIDLKPFTIEPSIRLAYYEESSDGYSLDNNGGVVQGQDVELFRVALDPRLTYSHLGDDGVSAGPYIHPALVAEWQDASGGDTGWDLFGTVEAGLNYATPDFSLSASVQAAGIGSDNGIAYSAGASLNIPW